MTRLPIELLWTAKKTKTKCLKDPTYAIFFKSGVSRISNKKI